MTMPDTTHPSGPAGPRPGGPPPPQPPYPTEPPKDTGPINPTPENPDPMPVPHPTPQKRPARHLVDFGYRIEVLTGECDLVAVAEVRTAGLWWMQTTGHDPFFVGGRETAETAMRELVA